MLDVADAPAIGDVLYSDRWIGVDLVTGHRGDGSVFPHRRVTFGNGHGAIVICLAGDMVAMVRQPRPAPGLPSSLELIRGGTKDDSATEALRELFEETGLSIDDIRDYRLLGFVHEDTGIVANRVAVWLVEADLVRLAQVPEWESAGVAEWMPLNMAMFEAELTCGMTLAAFLLLARDRRAAA